MSTGDSAAESVDQTPTEYGEEAEYRPTENAEPTTPRSKSRFSLPSGLSQKARRHVPSAQYRAVRPMSNVRFSPRPASSPRRHCRPPKLRPVRLSRGPETPAVREWIVCSSNTAVDADGCRPDAPGYANGRRTDARGIGAMEGRADRNSGGREACGYGPADRAGRHWAAWADRLGINGVERIAVAAGGPAATAACASARICGMHGRALISAAA